MTSLRFFLNQTLKQWLTWKKEGKVNIQKFEYLIQKFEYLNNKKSFLDEIKNIFHSF